MEKGDETGALGREHRPAVPAPTADKPVQLVTLCLIVQGGRVLLMRKKRGLGAGKINAPGGKVDPRETPRAAAIRETEEELCVTPIDPELRGSLRFYFRDGPTFHCLVYRASEFVGQPAETAEAVPCWYPEAEIPYAEMWGDDRHWLPLLLRGDRFEGTVDVIGEEVTGHSIHVITNAIALS